LALIGAPASVFMKATRPESLLFGKQTLAPSDDRASWSVEICMSPSWTPVVLGESSGARRMSAPPAMSLAPTSPGCTAPALDASKRQCASVPGTSG
jgi:hypothetical protein